MPEQSRYEIAIGYTDDKLGILDARVLFTNGDQMNLEMQVITYTHWNNRSLFYLCKMIAGQLKKGKDYSKLKKCVQVSILNFDWFADDEYFWHRVRPIDEITGECYNENFELQVWELKKLEKAMLKYGTDSVDVLLQKMQDSGGGAAEKYAEHTEILTWMQFFNGKSKEDFRKMAESNEDMKSAYETLEKMSADLEKRLEYEAREKAIRDYNSVMVDSFRRGQESAQAEIQKEKDRANAAESRADAAEAEVARLRAALAAKGNS